MRNAFVSRTRSLISALIRDERGQTTVEYILILIIATGGAIGLVRLLIRSLDKGVLRLGSVLEMDLKTGRMPVGDWKF